MGETTRKTDDENSLFINHECEMHGPFLQFARAGNGGSRCPSCLSDSTTTKYLPRFGIANSALNSKQSKALEAAGVPSRFLDCRYENFFPQSKSQTTVLQAFTAYAVNFGVALADCQNLIVTGKPGTGKTHLGVAALAVAALRGCSIRYADARKRGALRSRKDMPDLTVIDNVGLLLRGDIQAVQDLVMDRYDAAKPTILLGAISRADLPGLLGEYCLDRLREGGSKIFQFDWDSYRRSKQTENVPQ